MFCVSLKTNLIPVLMRRQPSDQDASGLLQTEQKGDTYQGLLVGALRLNVIAQKLILHPLQPHKHLKAKGI